ncbi:MAG TPA: translation initiation factor IF-1 [Vicinamibacteria bacterium]|nr:translation initiation factor IF-1 [Vicinamibacteria bacterium]
MAKDSLEADARVVEALPNALFRVELETGARSQVLAHVAAGSNLLRVLPGDPVVVELMPYDMTRGRIVRRRS